MRTFVLMIAGCRHYTKYWQFAKEINKLIKRVPKDQILIVEGGARGTDYLAYLYGRRNNIPVVTYPADWDGLGNRAGYVRNIEMLEDATHLAAFWDYESRGTRHSIENSKKYEVSLRVIRIGKDDGKGKPRKGNGYWRKDDGETISRNRKRRAAKKRLRVSE